MVVLSASKREETQGMQSMEVVDRTTKQLNFLLFLVPIPSVLLLASASTFFFSVHYLLNQLMDFDQTLVVLLLLTFVFCYSRCWGL